MCNFVCDAHESTWAATHRCRRRTLPFAMVAFFFLWFTFGLIFMASGTPYVLVGRVVCVCVVVIVIANCPTKHIIKWFVFLSDCNPCSVYVPVSHVTMASCHRKAIKQFTSKLSKSMQSVHDGLPRLCLRYIARNTDICCHIPLNCSPFAE